MTEGQITATQKNDVLACETAGREQEFLFMVRHTNQSLPSGVYLAHVVDGRMIHNEPLEYPEEVAEELISFWKRDTTAAGQRELRKAIDLVFRSLDEVDLNTDPEACANLKLRGESDDPDVLGIWSDGEWGVVRLVTHPEVHRRYPGDGWCGFGHYDDCTLWLDRHRLTRHGRKVLLDMIGAD